MEVPSKKPYQPYLNKDWYFNAVIMILRGQRVLIAKNCWWVTVLLLQIRSCKEHSCHKHPANFFILFSISPGVTRENFIRHQGSGLSFKPWRSKSSGKFVMKWLIFVFYVSNWRIVREKQVDELMKKSWRNKLEMKAEPATWLLCLYS